MLATAAGYEFDVDRGPDWLWIRIRSVETGSLPAASLAEQLKELVENHFIYRIVLELHRLPELSSQLIGELVQLDRYIQKHDGVLRICGLSPEGRAMLEMCGLDDLCLAYETREEAILGSCARACRDSAAEDPRIPPSITNKLPVRWRSLGRPPRGGSLPGPFAFDNTSPPCRAASRGLRWSRNATFWGRCRDSVPARNARGLPRD